MRIVARSTLAAFWGRHPETRVPLSHWLNIAKAAQWATMAEVQRSFPKAKALNAERARFEIHGGDYRLIAAFDFRRRALFIKFIGTRGEYDRIDALNVSLY
ncbi:MAG TPA: type II toxin-antitoxin system HigB family toxin [Rhizomicrobium sp.]|jgi:mRNA interferase HigB|nr:type II toxin-antitoxin system HigB family toxin [Rhizomicrobium sp.]